MSRLHNYGLTEASDKAYDLHIITPDLYDRWHAGLGPRQQNWLAAQNFTPKPGVAICLPDNDGHIEQAVGVVDAPYIWNGAKLSSSLPNAVSPSERTRPVTYAPPAPSDTTALATLPATLTH